MAGLSIARASLWLGASCLPVLAAIALPSGQPKKPQPPAGQQLFASKCAPCHGSKGQGGPGYAKALQGDLSQRSLAAFIKKSMPPGAKKCPAADADQIAAYIYGSFYSPIAQARIRPPRLELERLTVTQFKNAVADLVSNSHPATPDPAQHGLHGQYFKGKFRDPKNKVIDRVDPVVQFDFGTGAPNDKDFDPHNFAIQWTGSVLAPDTGEYEFSIHSRHSCQLWINGSRLPVVDGEVRSAKDPDPTGTVKLLGGRAYPITMVFDKATQGVDDKKKNIPSEPSYIGLLWTRPNHTQETIPTQFLFPEDCPSTYVVTNPFPPDDRSTGYERGDSVSKEWDDAVTTAALDAANYVAANLPQVTGVAENDKDRLEKLKLYCADFLARAFRRPLTDDLKQLYIVKQFAGSANAEMSVKRVVFLGIESPRFLYRDLSGPHDGYFAASQLSFGLWDSIPDPALEKAADQGQLSTAEQIKAQADRMMSDNRAWNKMRRFLLFWLKVDEVPDIVKDPKQYPGFDASIASDLRTGLELYLQNTAWDGASDYQELMDSDKEFLNGRLAKLYGVSLPADAPFQSVVVDPGQRAGIITQPYLLSRFAHLDGSDPIHRGVLIERNLLGRILNPPPQNFIPLSAASHPDMTTRERVSLQTKPAFCTQCHGIINPLGFTLESFDAIGRLRQTDNGKPIDATGTYRDRSGELVKFNGPKELANYLAKSEDAHDAFVEKLFLNVVEQPPMAYGPNTLSDLEASFSKDRYSIRSLLTDIVTKTAMPTGDSRKAVAAK